MHNERDRRLAIYAGQPIIDLLESVPGERKSSRINTAVERYLAIVNDELARIELTRGEWLALMDVFDGSDSAVGALDDPISWRSVWASVYDAHPDGEHSDVDYQALGMRLRDMSLGAKAAVFEAAARFWSLGNDADDYDAQLAQCGVKPRERAAA